jgi:hypothetical protein
MSLSPSPQPPVTPAALAGSTTLTFKLPSRRSSALLADRGLADLYKIFGVRASMVAARDGGDLVQITLSGSNYYAGLAHHWVIARVAPEHVTNIQLSQAQVSPLCQHSRISAFLSFLLQLHAVFGAKLQNLVALQLHSCCYAVELPCGSGNVLLQGGHQAVARAIEWISNMASAKRVNINLHAHPIACRSCDTSPPRHLTPFHAHAIKPVQLSSPSSGIASEYSNCAGAASPATFGPSDRTLALISHPLTSSHSLSHPLTPSHSLSLPLS